MRTPEKQIKNIKNARTYYGYIVSEAICGSDCTVDDREVMLQIINLSRRDDALALYERQSEDLKDRLQNIIEATVYGRA